MCARSWIPVPRSQLDARIAGEVARQLEYRVWPRFHDIDRQLSAVEKYATKLGERMTSAEDANLARLAELAGLIKAEFESLRQQVDAAVVDKDAAVAAGVSSALDEDSAKDAERLSGLIAEFEQVLPAQVPEVPVPAPGEPAELPEADSSGGPTA